MRNYSKWIIRWAFTDALFGITYSLLPHSIAIPRVEWYTGIIFFYISVASIIDVYRRVSIDHGAVFPGGIRLRKRKREIAFTDIEKIVVEKNSPSLLYTYNGLIEVRLNVSELVALARTELNYWAVEGRKATVTRGEGKTGFSAVYKPVGKYADAGFAWCLSGASIVGIAFLVAEEILAPNSFFLFIGLLLFPFVVKDYKEISVTIGAEDIVVKDENLERRVMDIADIEKIEKGLWRTKVSATDGKVLLLPRAFFLAADLIQGFKSGYIKRSL